MMRLPTATSAEGLDACFVGIPMDIGASNRSGTRYGPRQIRAESVMIRPYNMATGAAPFESLQVADIGDIAINTFNLPANMEIITRGIREILKHDCIPLTLGGDHDPCEREDSGQREHADRRTDDRDGRATAGQAVAYEREGECGEAADDGE